MGKDSPGLVIWYLWDFILQEELAGGKKKRGETGGRQGVGEWQRS